ncbi:hypothetical protein L1887_51778 [Cichorium endivia]|nr:hypothetical protein L1887_51778 [Cichorium endivia]
MHMGLWCYQPLPLFCLLRERKKAAKARNSSELATIDVSDNSRSSTFSKARPYIFITSNPAIYRAHHATTFIRIIDYEECFFSHLVYLPEIANGLQTAGHAKTHEGLRFFRNQCIYRLVHIVVGCTQAYNLTVRDGQLLRKLNFILMISVRMRRIASRTYAMQWTLHEPSWTAALCRPLAACAPARMLKLPLPQRLQLPASPKLWAWWLRSGMATARIPRRALTNVVH